MRKSFVTSYAFGAEAILQHWLWKTLKNATKSFGPLLKVFATDYDATTTCGTDAWELIFTLFPRAGAAITHQLIVNGFEQCMSIHDDSTATFTKYIVRLNESLVQLATVKPMSISEIYALAALKGLHLPPSARHERAYRDLMTFIDEGNALTLEEVLKIGALLASNTLATALPPPMSSKTSLLCVLLMLSAPVLAPSAVRVAARLIPHTHTPRGLWLTYPLRCRGYYIEYQ
jgi:hypothetical protein